VRRWLAPEAGDTPAWTYHRIDERATGRARELSIAPAFDRAYYFRQIKELTGLSRPAAEAILHKGGEIQHPWYTWFACRREPARPPQPPDDVLTSQYLKRRKALGLGRS